MISVTIPTNNSEKTIERALNSVKEFDEIIILDTGSTDKTLAIAQTYEKVKIYQTVFRGFGALRNYASSLAQNDWILVLDSDEEITEPLFQEISALDLDPSTLYSIPFNNYYNGRHIKSCGWYPDYHVRLYCKSKTSFDDVLLHEGVIVDGLNIKKLKSPINHYSYSCIDDFLRKMQNYSTLFAKQNCLKKRSSLTRAIFHAFFSFFKGYILKRGIFQGREGFIICISNANTTFYKYLKLEELNNKNKCS
jgi:glycosyltransferase involved in cell wall biosynthesis